MQKQVILSNKKAEQPDLDLLHYCFNLTETCVTLGLLSWNQTVAYSE